MNGKNEIHMNQSTMLEATQLWLADQFKIPPKAVSVKKNNENKSGGPADTFIVVVEQTPKPSNT